MELLIFGFLLGLACGPAIRSWVAWREYRTASRAVWLADETLRRLEEEHKPPREAA
jgi:hypothetical protein